MDERADAPDAGRGIVSGRRSYHDADLVFERHYYDYQLALRAVQSGAARRIAELQQRYSDTVNQAHRDWGQSAQDAYDRYLAVLRADRADEADERDAGDEGAEGAASGTGEQAAYRQYARTFNEGQESAQKVCAEAAEAFQRALRDTQNDVCDAWDGAFRDYISDVRGSWADIAIENVSPMSICAIAQTMIAAAVSAHSAEQVAGRRSVSSSDEQIREEGETR